MADWRDDAYGGRVRDTGTGDAALASMLDSRAICLELLALGMVIDYSAAEYAPLPI